MPQTLYQTGEIISIILLCILLWHWLPRETCLMLHPLRSLKLSREKMSYTCLQWSTLKQQVFGALLGLLLSGQEYHSWWCHGFDGIIHKYSSLQWIARSLCCAKAFTQISFCELQLQQNCEQCFRVSFLNNHWQWLLHILWHNEKPGTESLLKQCLLKQQFINHETFGKWCSGKTCHQTLKQSFPFGHLSRMDQYQYTKSYFVLMVVCRVGV